MQNTQARMPERGGNLAQQWVLRAEMPQEAPQGGRHPLIERLLALRGIAPDRREAFLDVRQMKLPEPTAVPGSDQAAAQLVQAVRDKRPVVLYGDYDVDGITGVSSLWHVLKHVGHEDLTQVFVPHRLTEGYGLRVSPFEDFPAGALVVTVDCGITRADVVREVQARGFDLVVTDHHTLDESDLPPCALVHPDLSDDEAGVSGAHLCGSAVAWLLGHQVLRAWHGVEALDKRGAHADATLLLADLLALAGMGAIADLSDLTGHGRTLATHGLRRIAHVARFPGLQAMIDECGLRSKKMDDHAIGFKIGPRINAIGRMDHAHEAVELLTTATGSRAVALARKLSQLNLWRQHVTRAIEAEAQQQAAACVSDAALVLCGAHWDGSWQESEDQPPEGAAFWHPGVVGIVAGRVAERWHRPAVLLCERDDGLAKGSARSVPGVDLHGCIQAALDAMGGLVADEGFGGHQMAAGLTLRTERVAAFREALAAQVRAVHPPEAWGKTLRHDGPVFLEELDDAFFAQLPQLAPYGANHARPVFFMPLEITSCQPMGAEGKHLNLRVRDVQGARRELRAVAFGEVAEAMRSGGCDRVGVRMEALCRPKVDEWNGRVRHELEIVDTRIV